ncbi:hypothetical protein DL770_002028 [Monosporascus sp. CRB-9-2]|nr:hypothetical protein DL770_002028 [Monosporascus sp. CRB-9-2]
MEQPKSYSNQRPAGKEHIPLYPRGFVAIRIIQLVIGLAIATLIASIYCLVAHFGPPQAYNYWAILGLDIFLLVFWLASFAVLAAQVAPYLAYYSTYSDYYGYSSYSDYEYYIYDAAYLSYFAILAGAAGLGGLEFILYIVSLSIHSVMLHRHRQAGLHCMPLGSSFHAAPGGGMTGIQPQLQQPNPQLAPAHHSNSGNPPQNMHPNPQQSTVSPVSPQPTGSSYVQGPPVPLNPDQPLYEVDGHERR